jgi:hypothetical protein
MLSCYISPVSVSGWQSVYKPRAEHEEERVESLSREESR